VSFPNRTLIYSSDEEGALIFDKIRYWPRAELRMVRECVDEGSVAWDHRSLRQIVRQKAFG
jgi:hypothetical protein